MLSIEDARQNADTMLQLIDKASFSKRGILIRRFAQAVADGTEDQVIKQVTEEMSCLKY